MSTSTNWPLHSIILFYFYFFEIYVILWTDIFEIQEKKWKWRLYIEITMISQASLLNENGFTQKNVEISIFFALTSWSTMQYGSEFMVIVSDSRHTVLVFCFNHLHVSATIPFNRISLPNHLSHAVFLFLCFVCWVWAFFYIVWNHEKYHNDYLVLRA